jgi:hypothetical protein
MNRSGDTNGLLEREKGDYNANLHYIWAGSSKIAQCSAKMQYIWPICGFSKKYNVF